MDSTAHRREDRAGQAVHLALKGFIVVGAFVGYEWSCRG
jgi:hypothetical protein